MAAKPADPIFLDTSIQIARKVHRPEIQHSITNRLRQHQEIVSGTVVRQEFKRRLLKEAVYLLKQLDERKSYEKVHRHVLDTLAPLQYRKMKICLDLLVTVDEEDEDEDRFDRTRLMLRDLIKNGIDTAEAHLTSINKSSGCACAHQPILEKKPFVRYELGTDRCSKVKEKCGIRAFLNAHRELLLRLHDYLAAVPDNDASKTAELKSAQSFIRRYLDAPDGVENEDPCLKVGDLLIALESVGCSTIYTMNVRETQHLARFLNQSMVYRPPNSDRPEVECLAHMSDWNDKLSGE